jgi:hypothetical protein
MAKCGPKLEKSRFSAIFSLNWAPDKGFFCVLATFLKFLHQIAATVRSQSTSLADDNDASEGPDVAEHDEYDLKVVGHIALASRYPAGLSCRKTEEQTIVLAISREHVAPLRPYVEEKSS